MGFLLYEICECVGKEPALLKRLGMCVIFNVLFQWGSAVSKSQPQVSAVQVSVLLLLPVQGTLVSHISDFPTCNKVNK